MRLRRGETSRDGDPGATYCNNYHGDKTDDREVGWAWVRYTAVAVIGTLYARNGAVVCDIIMSAHYYGGTAIALRVIVTVMTNYTSAEARLYSSNDNPTYVFII